MPNAPILNPGDISGPQPSEDVTNAQTLDFSGTGSNAGFEVDLLEDGTAISSTTADGNGNYQFGGVGAPADDGTYGYQVTDYDTNGNYSATSPGTNVTIERSTQVTGVSVSGNGIDGNGAGDVPAGTAITYTLTFDNPVEGGSGGGLSSSSISLNNDRTAGFTGLSADGTQATYLYVTSDGDDVGQLQIAGLNFDQVRDHAGNVPSLAANEPGGLRVDTTAPTISVDAAEGAAPRDVSVTGNVAGYDSGTQVTVTEYDASSGATLAAAAANVDGSGNFDAALEADAANVYFVATNTDGAGNAGSSGAAGYQVPTPGVSVSASEADGDPDTIAVSGSVSNLDPGQPNVTVVETNSAGQQVDSQTVSAASGSFSTTFAQAVPGDYTFTASNTDGVGETGSATAGYDVPSPVVIPPPVVIPTPTPTPTSYSPMLTIAAMETGTDPDLVTVSGTLTGADPTSTSVTVSEMAQDGTVLAQQTVPTDPTGLYDAQFTETAPGTYEYQATNTPTTGTQATSAEVPYVVPGATTVVTVPGAPTLALSPSSDTGTSDSDHLTDASALTFTGTAAANSTVTISGGPVDGAQSADLGSTTADAQGNYKISDVAAGAADGTYDYHATATLGGVPGAPSNEVDVTVDRTAPTVTSLTQSGNGVDAQGGGDVGAGEVITYDLRTTEGVYVTAGPDGAEPDLLLSNGQRATLVQSSATPGTTDLQFTYMVKPGDDTPYLYESGYETDGASVTDAAGNALDGDAVAARPSQMLRVDTTAPGVTLTGTPSTDPATGETTLELSGQASGLDPQADAGATYAIHSRTAPAGSAPVATGTVGADGSFSFADPTVPGENDLYATVTDGAGNVGTSNDVTYDSEATVSSLSLSHDPSVDTGASQTDGVTDARTLAFAGTAAPDSVVQLSVQAIGADGTPGAATAVGSTTADGNGDYSFTSVAAPDADGRYVYQVADSHDGATSGLGDPVDVTIDRTAPRIASLMDSGAGISPTGKGDVTTGEVVTYDLTPTEGLYLTPGADGAEPDLLLSNGERATLVQSSATPGTTDLRFTYTVKAGDDTDYLYEAKYESNGSTATDLAGNALDGDAIDARPAEKLRVDTTAPGVSLTGTPSTDPTTGETTLDLVGQASGLDPQADAGATYAIYARGAAAGAAPLATGTVAADGSFSYADPTGPGTTDVYATVTDGAGNVGTSSDVTYQAQPGGVSSLSLSHDPSVDTGASQTDGVTDARTLAFAGTATPSSVVQLSVQALAADGTPGTATVAGTTMADADGNYAFSSVTAPDADGRYVYQVADSHDGTTFGPAEPVDVTIDRTAPTATSVSVSGKGVAADGSGDVGTGEALTFDVKASEPVYLTGSATPYLVLSNGARATLDPSSQTSGATDLTFDYTVAKGDDTPSLTVGSIVAADGSVTDAAGNAIDMSQAPAEPTGTLQVDTTAPATTLSLSLSTTDFEDTSDVTLSGHVTGYDPADTGVTVTDSVTGDAYDATLDADGDYSVDATLAPGHHDLVATNVDAAGNVGSSPDVTYDVTAPEATAPRLTPSTDLGSSQTDGVTSAADGLEFTGTGLAAGQTVNLYEVAQGPVGGTTSKVAPVLLGTGTSDADGAYDVKVTGDLPDGIYDVAVLAGTYPDEEPFEAGQYSPTSEVTVDRSAPSVTVDQAGGTTTTQTVTLTGHVTSTSPAPQDVGQTVTVSEVQGGRTVVVGQGTLAPDGSYSVPVTLAQGVNALTVGDTTVAGVTGTATVTYDYEPAVSSPAPTPVGTTGVATTPVTTSGGTDTGTGTTSTTTVTTAQAAPSGSIDQAVTMHNEYYGTLTGQVADPSQVASVEIFQGDRDLGAAKVGEHGGFSFLLDEGPGTYRDIHAIATGTDGQQTEIDSNYDLTTGVKGRNYTGYLDVYNQDDVFTGQYYYRKDGDLLFKDEYSTDARGDQIYTYSGGDFFKDKDYTSFTDTYDASGKLISHTEVSRSGPPTPVPGGGGTAASGAGTGTSGSTATSGGGLFGPGTADPGDDQGAAMSAAELVGGTSGGGATTPATPFAAARSVISNASTSPADASLVTPATQDAAATTLTSSDQGSASALLRHHG